MSHASLRHSPVKSTGFRGDSGVPSAFVKVPMSVRSVALMAALCLATSVLASAPPDPGKYSEWRLPAVGAPAGNETTPARVELGKMLFFDPRFSRNQNMSCATCHNPSLGWSDGLDTAVGHNGKKLGRATPTVTNAAYNSIQMWDGRKASLEDQALGPMQSTDEMHADFTRVIAFLESTPGYRRAFAAAYPGEPVSQQTFAKAIAAYERTVVTTDSAFDKWLQGDQSAMSAAAQRGLSLFVDADKGNCAACHSAPNFTDNGFHNIGLASYGVAEPDLGRFNERRIASMKGAFKTPQLRNITRTAPYFHDGSARNLREVIDHYVRGGDVKTNLSASLKPLSLTERECQDLMAFLESLSSTAPPQAAPLLP